jgi:hypothetical protein
MLKLAIEANLPIVAVTTRDRLNLPDVIKFLTNKNPLTYIPAEKITAANSVYLFYAAGQKGLDLAPIYQRMVAMESTLLIVNPDKYDDIMFRAGEVPVPKAMLKEFLNSIMGDEERASELVTALGGVNLKETAELARLTMARDDSLTPSGLVATRKQFFQSSNGLTQVDPSQNFYLPDDDLADFITKEKHFFFNSPDPRLMPRGLLFDGPPGTGKTEGAKYLAKQWGVPLFRLDIGATKNKFVGESEANMQSNLSRLDHEEPCVVLLDEVEKIFTTSRGENDGNTTTSMLSQLLWWLAERRSRVFVVMTTNASEKLPKELHRQGRIDDHMWFNGLSVGPEAEAFVDSVFKTFKNKCDYNAAAIVKYAFQNGSIPDGKPRVSQAALTTAVYDWIKETAALK